MAPWLYCPVDGLVMDAIRALGVDPGATLIRHLDEERLWRLQDVLGVAASAAGVRRVWCDDVWAR